MRRVAVNERCGAVYRVQPEPFDPDSTTWVEAGAVRFGLEARVVTADALREVYRDDPAALAEIEANSPPGGFQDSGLSVHVVDSADGHEYLRFDAFEDDPHYHYIHPSGDHNHWVPFDAVAGGDVVDFTLACLRERLLPMIECAGGGSLALRLDPSEQIPAIDELARRIERLRRGEASKEAADTPAAEAR